MAHHSNTEKVEFKPQTYLRLISYARPYWLRLTIGIVAGMLAVGAVHRGGLGDGLLVTGEVQGDDGLIVHGITPFGWFHIYRQPNSGPYVAFGKVFFIIPQFFCFGKRKPPRKGAGWLWGLTRRGQSSSRYQSFSSSLASTSAGISEEEPSESLRMAKRSVWAG